MGNLTLNGSVSGSITIAPPSTAGTNTVTLPVGTGTALVSSTAINAAITGTPSASTYLRGDGTWAAVSASGQLIRAPQILTSGTSYTTPANCNNIFVEMIGGGGGGGGVSTGATQGYGGNGGAASYGTKFVAVSPSTSYTIAIGSGGSAGGAAASGGSGGNTSITIGATTYTSGGGGGGGGVGAGGGGGGAGSNGTTTNCDQTLTPISAYSASASPLVQAGGSVLTPNGTFVGALTPAGTGTSTGSSANSYGTGGSGGRATGAAANGGAGFQGLMRIWEYT